jgi:hypothetical protein
MFLPYICVYKRFNSRCPMMGLMRGNMQPAAQCCVAVNCCAQFVSVPLHSIATLPFHTVHSLPNCALTTRCATKILYSLFSVRATIPGSLSPSLSLSLIPCPVPQSPISQTAPFSRPLPNHKHTNSYF